MKKNKIEYKMCQGGWDSHRWEINQRESLLFCNQCGCEISFEIDGSKHKWEIESVDQQNNTIHLYCIGCLEETIEC